MDELTNKSSHSAIREISSDDASSLLLRPPCSAEMGMYCWRNGAYPRIQVLVHATIHNELLASDMIKPLK